MGRSKWLMQYKPKSGPGVSKVFLSKWNSVSSVWGWYLFGLIMVALANPSISRYQTLQKTIFYLLINFSVHMVFFFLSSKKYKLGSYLRIPLGRSMLCKLVALASWEVVDNSSYETSGTISWSESVLRSNRATSRFGIIGSTYWGSPDMCILWAAWKIGHVGMRYMEARISLQHSKYFRLSMHSRSFRLSVLSLGSCEWVNLLPFSQKIFQYDVFFFFFYFSTNCFFYSNKKYSFWLINTSSLPDQWSQPEEFQVRRCHARASVGKVYSRARRWQILGCCRYQGRPWIPQIKVPTRRTRHCRRTRLWAHQTEDANLSVSRCD